MRMRALVRSLIGTLGVALVMAWLPGAAQAYDCGKVTYYYDVPGDSYSYYATFQSLDFHSGISVQGMRCSDARSFVWRYARAAFRDASSRTDYNPPGTSRDSVATAQGWAMTLGATTALGATCSSSSLTTSANSSASKCGGGADENAIDLGAVR